MMTICKESGTFKVVHEHGHYAVYKDDHFYCSADTVEEALKDIETYEKLTMQEKK